VTPSGATSFDLYQIDLNAGDTVEGGMLTPVNSDDAGCFFLGGSVQVLISVASPPASLDKFRGVQKLPFGNCYQTTDDSEFGSGLDVACITDNGWGFDIAESRTSSIPTSVLQQVYSSLAADL